jgi:hypothetical protein
LGPVSGFAVAARNGKHSRPLPTGMFYVRSWTDQGGVEERQALSRIDIAQTAVKFSKLLLP